MKLILTLLIIFLGTNLAFADKYIQWSDDLNFTWNNFQGEIGRYPDEDREPSENELAFTWGYSKLLNYNFTKIDSSICQVQITDINTIGVFDTESSWVQEDQKSNQKLLNHEHRHFDIIEIFARQIETQLLFRIIECPNGFYDEPQIHNKIRLLASDIGNTQQKMHDIYDTEIKNGISTQDSWDKKIGASLVQDDFIPLFHKELPPIMQLKNGIKSEDVKCTEGWILLKNSSDKPICVTPAASKILEKRGWTQIKSEIIEM